MAAARKVCCDLHEDAHPHAHALAERVLAALDRAVHNAPPAPEPSPDAGPPSAGALLLPTREELLQAVAAAQPSALEDVLARVWPQLAPSEALEPWYIFPASGWPTSLRGKWLWEPAPTWPEPTVRLAPAMWLRARLDELTVAGGLARLGGCYQIPPGLQITVQAGT